MTMLLHVIVVNTMLVNGEQNLKSKRYIKE